MNDDQAARMELLTEELWHSENYLFLTSWYLIDCILCNLYYGKNRIFASFEELIYHLDCEHMPNDRENAILAEEAVLEVVLFHKLEWEKQHGRFSN